MRYKIYYADGSTFTDEDGPPHEAPARGVIVIAQFNDAVGYEVLQGNDYFAYKEEAGGWYSVDIFGLWDYLVDPGHKTVKFGRTIDNAEFSAIMGIMSADDYLPRKSARFRHERKQ